jgi:hypothetical protein
MRKLALPSSQHLAPPYLDYDEMFRDAPRQEWRKLRKRLGLPASNEARIIGQMLKTLRPQVEESLGHPISRAAASFPKLIALYEEEIWDAFEWAGLEYLQVLPWYGITYQFMSSQAANGLGLCSDYNDTPACKKDLEDTILSHTETVLNIRYSSDTISIEWPIVHCAYYWWISPDRILQDFDLGLKHAHSTPDYWQRVHDRIWQWFYNQPGRWKYTPPAKIFLTGDSADDKRFRQILKDVGGWQGNKPSYFEEDALFMAAKGTAELAKRAAYLNPDNRPPVWRK